MVTDFITTGTALAPPLPILVLLAIVALTVGRPDRWSLFAIIAALPLAVLMIVGEGTGAGAGDPGGQAGLVEAVEQLGKRGQAGLGFQYGIGCTAQHSQQASHLDQGISTGGLHPVDRDLRCIGVPVDQVEPSGLRLQHHDTQAVGDDIVELPGQPSAFPREGQLLLRPLRSLKLPESVRQSLGLGLPAADA